MYLTVADVAAATSGRRSAGDPEAELISVTLDSRHVVPGALFVALRAERDGHDFVPAAVAAGAKGVLMEVGRVQPFGPEGVPRGLAVVEVEDTRAALLNLGRFVRRQLLAPVVGITGSVGKTSTKDLTAAALARRWRTTASEKSFNNELGVPLTLVNAPDDTEVVVIEMGARGPGHIALLCDVARPGIAVVTAVAAVHTELFGSIEAIAAAKAELVEAIPAGGTAVLNSDDVAVAAMAEHAAAGVQILGFSALGLPAADVIATSVTVDDELRASFRLNSPWGSIDVRLGVCGVQHVGNALAAATVALRCDVALDEVAAGLAQASLSPWRMALGRTPGGAAVLNDAYNANPTSMEAAMRSLARLPARRWVAVVGEMAELGPEAGSAHRAVADLADRLGLELVVVGTAMYGRPAVPDIDAALEVLAAGGPLGPETAVLVKASRVAGLERLALRLTGSEQ